MLLPGLVPAALTPQLRQGIDMKSCEDCSCDVVVFRVRGTAVAARTGER